MSEALVVTFKKCVASILETKQIQTHQRSIIHWHPRKPLYYKVVVFFWPCLCNHTDGETSPANVAQTIPASGCGPKAARVFRPNNPRYQRQKIVQHLSYTTKCFNLFPTKKDINQIHQTLLNLLSRSYRNGFPQQYLQQCSSMVSTHYLLPGGKALAKIGMRLRSFEAHIIWALNSKP